MADKTLALACRNSIIRGFPRMKGENALIKRADDPHETLMIYTIR